METINISKLKAHLSSVIERVKKGAKVSILDRKLPVALLSPITNDETPLIISFASRSPRLPRSIKNTAKADVVDILLEDRRKR